MSKKEGQLKKCIGCDQLKISEALVVKKLNNWEKILISKLSVVAKQEQSNYTLKQNYSDITKNVSEIKKITKKQQESIDKVLKHLPQIKHTSHIIKNFDDSVKVAKGIKWLVIWIFKIIIAISVFMGAWKIVFNGLVVYLKNLLK